MKQFHPVTRLSNGIRDERSEAIFLCSVKNSRVSVHGSFNRFHAYFAALDKFRNQSEDLIPDPLLQTEKPGSRWVTLREYSSFIKSRTIHRRSLCLKHNETIDAAQSVGVETRHGSKIELASILRTGEIPFVARWSLRSYRRAAIRTEVGDNAAWNWKSDLKKCNRC